MLNKLKRIFGKRRALSLSDRLFATVLLPDVNR